MKKSVIRAGIWGVMPWFVATVAVIAFGASFSELQRMRGRFGDVTRHQFHDHQDVRQFMIRAALADLDRPIVVIGDSIAEMSRLPDEIGGRPVVNAGIGGATISDFETLAPRLLETSRPSLIVVALGANDAGSPTVQRDYVTLLSHLKTLAPRLLAVSVASGTHSMNDQIKAAAESESVQFVQPALPNGSLLSDGIHLNAAGYRAWVPALVSAVSRPTS